MATAHHRSAWSPPPFLLLCHPTGAATGLVRIQGRWIRVPPIFLRAPLGYLLCHLICHAGRLRHSVHHPPPTRRPAHLGHASHLTSSLLISRVLPQACQRRHSPPLHTSKSTSQYTDICLPIQCLVQDPPLGLASSTPELEHGASTMLCEYVLRPTTPLQLCHTKDGIPQVSIAENEILSAKVTEKEVRDAVFQLKHNKAPGPDGFPAEFYQELWGLIKDDIMALFNEFFECKLSLFSLNFDTITLLPKGKEAKQIQQYRPIYLLNVSFKVFTKVVANRTNLVAKKVNRPSQTAFMAGRNIMEGVVILHKTLLHKNKLNGVVLKLDFEKAYDKVNWSFLHQALRMKGFSPRWCQWIESIISKGSVNIKVNDDYGRQGDPLSPFLFNLVADMVAIPISRAKDNGQFHGVVPHLVDGGLSIHADDTILLLEHDLEEAKNMKQEEYVQLFGCKEGSFPFRYIGIPIHHRKINNKDWISVEKRFQKNLGSWKGKLHSAGGRQVLINSVLSCLPMFMLSFFEAPKGVLKKLDYYKSRFFWQCDEHKKKYRLAKWGILRKPKHLGGLGILNLEVQNRCLLSKWLFKVINEDGLWQDLLKRKYLSNNSISQVSKKPGDSHFSPGLMHVNDQFLALGSFEVKVGNQASFWEDYWIGDKPFMEVYPSLYRIVRKTAVTIASVLKSISLNVSFRRSLTGDNLMAWYKLISKVANINQSEENDTFKWRLHKNGIFSVKTEVILTKDNLAKHRWQGSTKCCFCHADETIQHLFFDCHVARGTYWIRSWSSLFKEEEKETMRTGCSLLEATVMEIFNKFGWKRRLRD
ncbi:hypothetical protein U9M48_011408 [Paspalum notatum var. saurae]|uniref:Reverse transcriptase domain-containing protein n=1 Tax=Paspalum notatum var. saurae TaxID=547442 RepID=A0AAQ3WH41_PASNO